MAGVSAMVAAGVAVANIAMVMGIASVFLVWHPRRRYGPRIPRERGLLRRLRRKFGATGDTRGPRPTARRTFARGSSTAVAAVPRRRRSSWR